jgi:hypothetical protein
MSYIAEVLPSQDPDSIKLGITEIDSQAVDHYKMQEQSGDYYGVELVDGKTNQAIPEAVLYVPEGVAAELAVSSLRTTLNIKKGSVWSRYDPPSTRRALGYPLELW